MTGPLVVIVTRLSDLKSDCFSDKGDGAKLISTMNGKRTILLNTDYPFLPFTDLESAPEDIFYMKYKTCFRELYNCTYIHFG